MLAEGDELAFLPPSAEAEMESVAAEMAAISACWSRPSIPARL
jgi:hypothetical protein